jgi:hypothetical protein
VKRDSHPILARVALVASLSLILILPVAAQWPPFAAPATPQSQRNALAVVRSEVNRLQNATKVAPNYGAQGSGHIWQAFQGVRQAYTAFVPTLTPQQQASGAAHLAELDAGLGIIEEAFANYQADLAAGHPERMAIRSLCRVMQEGSALWLQELNKTCSQLRVGWGAPQ